MKVLIIGKDSYLADGLDFENCNIKADRIKRPYKDNFEQYNNYDIIINFCIQPEHFSHLLPEDEMIDIQIAKHLKGGTKFIFLSSRKVYGSSTILKEYSETDELKPFDFYSKNKVNIEKHLHDILGEKLIIFRTGNVIGFPPKRNCLTFASWLPSQLLNNKKVIVTLNKNARKDFISKRYFQFVLKEAILKDLYGVYNVGAGFAITIEELMKNLIDKTLLEFIPQESESEQFILNCNKLQKFIPAYTKDDLLKDCTQVRAKLSALNLA